MRCPSLPREVIWSGVAACYVQWQLHQVVRVPRAQRVDGEQSVDNIWAFFVLVCACHVDRQQASAVPFKNR